MFLQRLRGRSMHNNQNKPRGLRPLQKSYFDLFGQEKPKPIPPKLVLIFKYPLAAMISQLLFWKGMEIRKDGYIFKTEKDFVKELGLKSAQQKLAIKKGKEFGFLDVVRKGIPAKRHYRLNYNRLIEVTVSEAERKGIVLTKGHIKLGEKRQDQLGDNKRSITDNTTETTARYHRTESASDILSRRYRKQ